MFIKYTKDRGPILDSPFSRELFLFQIIDTKRKEEQPETVSIKFYIKEEGELIPAQKIASAYEKVSYIEMGSHLGFAVSKYIFSNQGEKNFLLFECLQKMVQTPHKM